MSGSPTNGNGPTQGQRKTLTRVGIEPTTFGLDHRISIGTGSRYFFNLQERQSEGCKEIPRVISSLYVNIIQNVMGNPPDLTVLKAVCEFLIAVHPTDDVRVLHAPSRCYLREHSLDFG